MVETRAMRIRARTATWADLEHVEGIFLTILSRLPPRAIRLFRSVNKYWYHSITHKHFVKMQLSVSREKPCYITCPDMDIPMVLYSIKQESLRKFRLNTIDPAERDQGESMYMVSSFNGLICCVNDRQLATPYHDLQTWIVNPCTGETLLLPQGRPSFMFEPSVGVAYGSTTYKVFRIFSAGRKVPLERVVDGYEFRQGQRVTLYSYTLVYECEVYSSITGLWENIGPVPCVPMFHLSPFRCGHVFVGGRVYWLSSLRDEGAILCVDFEGRFEVIQFPPYDPNQNEEDMITEGTYMFILQGRLALVILHPEHMDVWMLEGSGQNGSWILVCQGTVPVRYYDYDDMVLAMTSINDQIICVTETKWCSYDMATGKWKRGRTNHAGYVDNPTVHPFTESVFPCAGLRRRTHQNISDL